MVNYTEIEGDLIKLALEGKFYAIAHGCNCQCVMGAGLAPQMAKAFGCDKYKKEDKQFKGDINKLGTIDYQLFRPNSPELDGMLTVVNCYTQYMYGTNHLDGVSKPLDYEALTLCLRKMNHLFKGKHIGLPQIGCHLAGGDWDIVKEIIKKELKDCQITVVIYKPE